MKILIPSTNFKKRMKKIPKEIVVALKKKMAFFEEDEFSMYLNNHKLHGEYNGFRSINITADWRLVYKKDGENYLLVTVDTHSNLYE